MLALRLIRSELSTLKTAVTSDTAGLKSEVAKITGLILKCRSSMQQVFFYILVIEIITCTFYISCFSLSQVSTHTMGVQQQV